MKRLKESRIKERKAKRRKRFRVVMEIILMALGVLCGIMPQPFPLLVPILIGTVRIVGRAVEKVPTSPPAPAPVVYCNGQNAPEKTDKKMRTEVRGGSDNVKKETKEKGRAVGRVQETQR